MIISILNQKGGAGKTTLATNLSRSISLKSKSVLLVDSDPQGSARDWHAVSDGSILNLVGLDRPTLNKDVLSLSKNYDYIIIDGAPQIAEMAIAAVKCSDLILIPVQPSPYDVWASEDLVDIIKARQNITDGNPRAAFVISRQITKTNLSKEIREALSGYQLPVFNTGTTQRIIYPKAAALGYTVFEIEPEGEAAKEINLLTKEIMEFIDEHVKSR